MLINNKWLKIETELVCMQKERDFELRPTEISKLAIGQQLEKRLARY